MSDPDIERKRRFSQAIQRLHAAYGRGVEPHELRAWWGVLAGYREDVLALACERAMRDGDGKYPPTAEQVRRHATSAAKATPPPGERLALPPGPIAGKAARIMATDDPWEALARLWEAEDAHAGRGPHATTPQAVGARRWADFWATWDRAAGMPRQRTETGLGAILVDSGEQDAQTVAARATEAHSDE